MTGPRTTRTIVLAQFGAVVTLIALGLLLAKFVGGVFDILLYMSFPLLLGVSLIAVIVWAIWPPRWTKLGLALLAGATALALVAGTASIRVAGDRLFFETRRARLDQMTRAILEYGRIHEMSDGQRYYKELNGELIAYAAGDVRRTEDPQTRPILPVEEVLRRDGIERQMYDDFRARLRALKLIHFEVKPGYVAYAYDGILDNLDGYLFVRPGHDLPEMGEPLFGGELIVLRPLRGGWYWFATT